MKLLNSDFNISNSIRNLHNKISLRLSRVEETITQIWKRNQGSQKPSNVENFVSYIKDNDLKLSNNQKVTDFNLETNASEVDFDEIRREFDSRLLRRAIDNNESIAFEDDFVSSSDWADLAVREEESFNSLIIPKIEDTDLIEEFFISEIQKELNKVNPKLNAAEEKAAQSSLREQQSHKGLLINLQNEKKADLKTRLDTLEQEFKEKEERISNFKYTAEKLANQFEKGLSHLNAQFGFQDGKLANRANKLAKRRKKSTQSIAKESMQRLRKEFKVQSFKINEEVNSKFEEKEKAANQNLKEKLQSIQENLQKEKQGISKLSDENIKSLRSEIQSRREKLVKELQRPNERAKQQETQQLQEKVSLAWLNEFKASTASLQEESSTDSNELPISSETWQEMEAILKNKNPVAWLNEFKTSTASLQEESSTDSNELPISSEEWQEMEAILKDKSPSIVRPRPQGTKNIPLPSSKEGRIIINGIARYLNENSEKLNISNHSIDKTPITIPNPKKLLVAFERFL